MTLPLLTPMQLSEPIRLVNAKRLRSTVERLAGFPTRNTLSPMLADSANWLVSQYREIPGVQATAFSYLIPKGRRVPEDRTVVQVVAWINGKGGHATSLEQLSGQRVVLVGGHLDSLNLQVDPETGNAPGANDDASGTALALECATVLAGREYECAIVFAGFTGEEQGLHGSRALAKFAKANNWKLEAVLSCDTVGSSSNRSGQTNQKQVRVFSDLAETHGSRRLAKFIEWTVRKKLRGFGIKLVDRADRFGRGGDHTPFAQEGFAAVRFVEVHEEYSRQHTPDDLPEYMDWAYLANVTKANVAVLYELANAQPAPTNVRIERDQSHDTTISWLAIPQVDYLVYWRSTTSPVWEAAIPVDSKGKFTVSKINKDDHVFAVGTVGGLPVDAK